MALFQTIVLCVMIALSGVVLLGFRNSAREKRLGKDLRERLKCREACSDSALASVFPLAGEKEVAVKFRGRLSQTLKIEAEKIHPDDDLRDYVLNAFHPFLIASVASKLARDPKKTAPQLLLRFKNRQTKFADFVRAISQQST